VSCERVLVSTVMKCAGYAGSIYIVHVLEALHQGEAAKTDSSKKYYFYRLADEYIGHTSAGGRPRGPIYSSVPTRRTRDYGPVPHIFVG
jgi:hypothetical protein